ELLTGHPPVRGPTVVDTLDRVRAQEAGAPSRLQPKVRPDLEAICLKCPEKDVKRRYPTALALAEDLGRFRRGEVVQARSVSSLGRWIRWARRQPIKASFFGL